MSLKKETLQPLVEEYGAGILNVSVNDIIGHIEAKHGKLTSEQKRKVDKLAKSYSKKKFKEAEKAVVQPKLAPLRPASPVRVAQPTHIRFGSPSTSKHAESPKKSNVRPPTVGTRRHHETREQTVLKHAGPGLTAKHTFFADGPTKINVRSPTIGL